MAFKLALECYEKASGELRLCFDISNTVGSHGIRDLDDLAGVSAYLYARGVMTPVGLNDPGLRLTPEGIAMLEASMDRPEQPQGPFPAYNVVIGDVGAGAQVALGHGTYTQTQVNSQSGDDVRQLVALVQAAVPTWPEAQRQETASARTLLEREAQGPAPDHGMVKAAAAKIGGAALKIAETAGTQALLVYLKMHGWMP